MGQELLEDVFEVDDNPCSKKAQISSHHLDKPSRMKLGEHKKDDPRRARRAKSSVVDLGATRRNALSRSRAEFG